MRKLIVLLFIAFITTQTKAQSWNLVGNTGIIDSINFIGTTENTPFNIRVNNQKAGRIDHIFDNTFYGYQSGNSVSTGNGNTANGYRALYSNTTANYNTAIGVNALFHNTIGSENTATGMGALLFNTTGRGNTANGVEALAGNSEGSYNTANGHKTLTSNKGYQNTANGSFALFSNINGNGNTATGSSSLYANSDGEYNTANGYRTLYSNTIGISNTASGKDALFSNTEGNYNTAIGLSTLSSNTTGSSNSALGYGADVTSGNLKYATVIGAEAKVKTSNTIQLGNDSVTKVYAGVGTNATLITGGLQITGGTPAAGKVLTSDANGIATWQTLMGGATGWNLTGNSGIVDSINFIGTTDNAPFNIRVNNEKGGRIDPISGNTFYGHKAGNLNKDIVGQYNTANGAFALFSNNTGSSNTAIGGFALERNTTGSYNTAIGLYAINHTTIGKFNTANGLGSLYSNITGNNNTALGYFADVASSDLNYATAIGANAKVKTSNTIQLGNDSVTKVYAGVGTNATLITGGLQITGGTPAAGKVLTSDTNGVATWQTPIGGSGGTGWSLTGNAGTVDGTNFIGTTDNAPFNIRVNNQKAGKVDKTSRNTFYGYQSGNATIGYDNMANGYQALFANIDGEQNTAIGFKALTKNITGNGNTAVGYTAGPNSDALNNTTAIGAGAIVKISNTIVLGDATVTDVFSNGKFMTTSDARFKININESDVKGLEFIKKLRPVAYNFDTKKFQAFLTQNMPADIRQKYMNKDFSVSTAIRQSGFIAQEVEKAAQEIGYDFNGIHKPENANDNYSLAYSQFTVPLVKAVQELSKQNDSLKEKLNTQQQQIENIVQQLNQLKLGNSSFNNTNGEINKKDFGITTSTLKVYPNPANQSFTLTGNYELSNAKIQLSDMLGNFKNIAIQDIDKYSKRILVNNLSAGIYIITVNNGQKIETTKIIIQ